MPSTLVSKQLAPVVEVGVVQPAERELVGGHLDQRIDLAEALSPCATSAWQSPASEMSVRCHATRLPLGSTSFAVCSSTAFGARREQHVRAVAQRGLHHVSARGLRPRRPRVRSCLRESSPLHGGIASLLPPSRCMLPWPGISGRSSGESRPGFAAHTAGIAFTARMPVERQPPAFASPPAPRNAVSCTMFGLPSITMR